MSNEPASRRNILAPSAFLGLGLVATLSACGGSGDGSTATTTTTTITTTTTTTCAQAADFPDVSLRSNYIDWNDDGAAATITPSTSVSCIGGVVNVVSNGVPNFDSLGIGLGGANMAYQTNQKTWLFPASPARAASTTSLVHVLGPIGVLVNGVQFYTATEAPVDNYADAVLNGFTN